MASKLSSIFYHLHSECVSNPTTTGYEYKFNGNIVMNRLVVGTPPIKHLGKFISIDELPAGAKTNDVETNCEIFADTIYNKAILEVAPTYLNGNPRGAFWDELIQRLQGDLVLSPITLKMLDKAIPYLDNPQGDKFISFVEKVKNLLMKENGKLVPNYGKKKYLTSSREIKEISWLEFIKNSEGKLYEYFRLSEEATMCHYFISPTDHKETIRIFAYIYNTEDEPDDEEDDEEENESEEIRTRPGEQREIKFKTSSKTYPQFVLQFLMEKQKLHYCEHHHVYYYHSDGGENCPICLAEELVQPLTLLNYRANPIDYLGFKTSKHKNPKYLGVELEYELASSTKIQDALLFILKSMKGHVICKRDGSLSNGIEIVSAPADLDLHLEEFKKFFEHEKFPLLLSKDTTGMHVHIDRRDMNFLSIGKIVHFMQSKGNYEFIKKIGERESRFAVLGTDDMISSVFTNSTGGDRYRGLNVQNKNTAEFRIFSTPRTFNSFKKNMEFCDALSTFASPGVAGIKEMQVEHFTNFVHKNRGVYATLNKFIQKGTI